MSGSLRLDPTMPLRRLAWGAAFALACLPAALACLSAPAQAGPITIVAAESVYGDVAAQIGGAEVNVTSIMSAPGQDPHQFEPSPSAARAIAAAKLVIANGANYDPWIEKLLAATRSQRSVIVVADLVKAKPGDDPHLWYAPATMPIVATRIADELAARDPAHKEAYAQRLKTFIDSLAPIAARIRAIEAKHAQTPVTATEPVFGYMTKALGFAMRNERFQRAVMNGTEPSASDVAAMQDDLKGGKVKILFHNSQVSDDLTGRLRAVATAHNVPVVAVTETKPADKSYQAWVAAELDAVVKALDGGGS